MTEYRFGLIGFPLEHSWSPRLHQAALAGLDLAGEYRLYPIPPLPEGKTALQELLARLRTGAVGGLNVTIPHKQAVLPLLDELTQAAREIGAVNTIFCQSGRLVGDNTDAPGFYTDLKRLTAFKELLSVDTQPAALVLGAGGSARAVVYSLQQAGWQVTIAARRLEQAQELAGRYQLAAAVGHTGNPVTTAIRLEQSALHSFCSINPAISLVVNTTPVGMSPEISASPWPAELAFPQVAVVYDLVYNPAETALVRAARAAGLQAYTGLGMLVEQAALAFERWTGQIAPREMMRLAVATVGREGPT